MRRRRLGITALAVLGALLSGCGPMPTVCSAVGHLSTLTVDTAQVELDAEISTVCVDGVCSGAAVQSVEEGFISFDGRGGSGWEFTAISAPERVTVRLYSETGELLGSLRTSPQWVRVSGSEECGGNGEAVLTPS